MFYGTARSISDAPLREYLSNPRRHPTSFNNNPHHRQGITGLDTRHPPLCPPLRVITRPVVQNSVPISLYVESEYLQYVHRDIGFRRTLPSVSKSTHTALTVQTMNYFGGRGHSINTKCPPFSTKRNRATSTSES